MIVSEDERWSKKSYEASYEDGYAVAKVERFGELSVQVDSTGPAIRPLRIHTSIPQDKKSSFSFRIDDELSGIDSYEAYIGEKWCIPYYDKKSRRLTVEVGDPECPLEPGKRKFRLTVKDKVGNERTFIKQVRVEAP